MASTFCPEDFAPNLGTINVLKAWFAIERAVKIGRISHPAQMWLMGDRHIDDAFICDRYQIARFTGFWSDDLQSGRYQRKKSNWQTAYQNDIKKAWPMACMDYERNHGKRSDSGSNGFKPFGEAMKPVIKNKPVQLKYKIPERPEAPPGPTNAADAFKLLRRG